jgi:hypothetical protein
LLSSQICNRLLILVNKNSTHTREGTAKFQPPRPPHATTPYWARESSLSRLHDHTQTHHTR